MNNIHINGKTQKPFSQSGFSMIEILIAIVIVSLGLLGIVRMQALNIKYMNDARLRSIANQLSNDIIDRMRANPTAMVTGDYNIGFGDSLPNPLTNCKSATANCTTSQLADYDVNSWLCTLGSYNANNECTSTLKLQGQLTNGQGGIRYNSVNGTTTVIIRWLDQADKTNWASVSMSTRI